MIQSELLQARLAYADPPYLGCSAFYDHPEAAKWDNPIAHGELMHSLHREFDGWALSLSSPSLVDILPLAPKGVRVMAWVKPFASFKPGVRVAYAWEPLIVKPARSGYRWQPTVRDWVSANITLQRGLAGAKPVEFCNWLFDVLGAQPGDQFEDVFPGTGIVGDCWKEWAA